MCNRRGTYFASGSGAFHECEYFDLELNGDVECEEVIKELNTALPDGFKVLTCEKLEKAKGLMSLVTEAIYEISLEVNTNDIEDTVKRLEEAFNESQIICDKQGKNGKEETVDIKPLIIDYTIDQITFSSIKLTCHCLAGSKNNLNPNFLVQTCKKTLGEELIEDYNIHRKELILS